MYINSPDFPKHKIMLGDSMNPQYRNSNPGASYFARNGFGYERLKLAEYVANQLNEQHKNDAAILQKFRKQAEEYKRSLRRNKSHFSQIKYEPPPIVSIKNIETEQSEEEVSKIKTPEKLILKEVGVETDANQRKLMKELSKKDKQIKKKNRVIKNSQEKIKDLAHKIRKMEYNQMQRDLEESKKFQNQSIVKIKELMSSMSDKLINNSEILENRTIKPSRKRTIEPKPQPVEPIKRKPSSRIKQEQSDRPIVSYIVRNQEDVVRQKNGINSYLKMLQRSRKRLQELNE